MTNDKIILIADGCSLPSNDDNTQQLLTDAYHALANVFADHGVYPDIVKAFDGDVYASFEDGCPVCRRPLQISAISRDQPHLATASANCTCGWSGRAVYQIIDYEEYYSDISSAEAMMDPGSCVTEHNQSPTYVPYYDVTRHRFRPGPDK